MGWVLRERRGPVWKQGWVERTLASISLPPFPLLAIFLIIFLLLSVSSYVKYKSQMQYTLVKLKLFLFFLPVILIFVARLVSKCQSFFFPRTKAEYGSGNRTWDLPWGVALLVLVLLVMISYRSTFQSMWSPIVWKPNYC
uniref:Uncharacterized protein n=1 Tax=Rhizophora mucronata TaxID=61149 RepID=A0A2P2QLY8_RHIMU